MRDSMSNPRNQVYQEKLTDNITLSPLQKYVKYGRFPFKFFVSVMIIVVTSFIVLNYSQSVISIGKYQEESMVKIYLGNDADIMNFNIYTASDFQNLFLGIFNKTQTLDSLTFQTTIVNYVKAEMTYSPRILKSQNTDDYTFQLPINGSITSPFDIQNISSVQLFLQKTRSFDLILSRIITVENDDDDQCLKCWRLKFLFDLEKISNIAVTIYPSLISCDFYQEKNSNYNSFITAKRKFDNIHDIGNDALVAHIVLFILAISSLIFHFRHIFFIMKLYTDCKIHSHKKRLTIRGKPLERKSNFLSQSTEEKEDFHHLKDVIGSQKSWDDLTLSEKWLFFDLWIVFGIVGNSLQIITCLNLFQWALLAENFEFQNSRLTFISYACWFAWIYIIRYLEYIPQVAVFTNIFRKSVPQILRFLVGFMPIYMAYLFLGMSMFWQFDDWDSFESMFTIQLSIMAGDSIRDSLTNIANAGLVGKIFLISFLLLFMLALHNMLISVICSYSYLWAKKTAEIQEGQKETIQKDLKEEKQDLTKSQDRISISLTSQNVLTNKPEGNLKNEGEDLVQSVNPFALESQRENQKMTSSVDITKSRRMSKSPENLNRSVSPKSSKMLVRQKTQLEQNLGLSLNISQNEKKKFLTKVDQSIGSLNQEIDEFKSQLKFHLKYFQIEGSDIYEVNKHYKQTLKRVLEKANNINLS